MAISPFAGTYCGGDEHCPAGQKCFRTSPYWPKPTPLGECRIPCGAGDVCPVRGGLPHACFVRDADRSCYPGVLGVTCRRSDECLAGRTCENLPPEDGPPAVDGGPDGGTSPAADRMCTQPCDQRCRLPRWLEQPGGLLRIRLVPAGTPDRQPVHARAAVPGRSFTARCQSRPSGNLHRALIRDEFRPVPPAHHSGHGAQHGRADQQSRCHAAVGRAAAVIRLRLLARAHRPAASGPESRRRCPSRRTARPLRLHRRQRRAPRSDGVAGPVPAE